MFTISSRADFASPDAFSSTDEARPWHSAEASLSPLALANRLRGGRVLVPVHGFNYRFQDATVLFRTVAQTAERHFPDAYDAVVGYTWPSATAAYSYFTAKGRVPEAGLRLRRWLDALWAAGCTIDLAGHSMGVRVAAAATREPGALRVRNLFLLAAAAGTDVLDPLSAAGDNVYVFHTRKDEALGRWYQLFEWETPLGYAVPAAEDIDLGPNVTVVDCTEVVPGHTAYRSSAAFVRVLADLLERSDPPATLSAEDLVDEARDGTGLPSRSHPTAPETDAVSAPVEA